MISRIHDFSLDTARATWDTALPKLNSKVVPD